MPIKLVQDDILKQKVEVIVNPANSHLRHGGGLARIIDTAANDKHDWLGITNNNAERELAEYTAEKLLSQWSIDHIAPLVPTGGAYTTSAGLLPFKKVIHAVGPVWGGGSFFEKTLLNRTIRSIFVEMEEIGAHSVAIPAISCGIFGFPAAAAARVIYPCLRSQQHKFDISIVLFEDEHFAAFAEVFQECETQYDVY